MPVSSSRLHLLYAHYPVLDGDRVYSCHVMMDERCGGGGLGGPSGARFVDVDGRVPHEDMPAAQALAVLEWGLNLVTAPCVTTAT